MVVHEIPFLSASWLPGRLISRGPLARLNVATFAGTPRADRELAEFKQRSKGAVCESFHYHLARLIEMLHAVERIEELMSTQELSAKTSRPKPRSTGMKESVPAKRRAGHSFIATLLMPTDVMTHADLLIATSQNNTAMNQAIAQTARRFFGDLPPGADPDEGILNRVEAAIRCFDPCLSCSTHALGNMPLVIDVIGSDGATLRRVARFRQ